LQKELARRTRQENKAKDKILFDIYTDYYGQHPEEVFYKNLDEKLIPLVESKYRNSMYAFVTINVNPVKWNQQNFIRLLLSKPFNYIRRWMACIEYHTEDGQHPHCHMLVEKFKKHYSSANKSKFITDFARRFKEFIDDNSKIDVNMPKKPSSKVKYILGQKKDKDKRERCVEDCKWRESLGIKHVYGNWEEVGADDGLVSPAPKPPPIIHYDQTIIPDINKIPGSLIISLKKSVDDEPDFDDSNY